MKLEKNVKIVLLIAVLSTIIVIIGGAYAFFTSNVTGNDLASSIIVDTASLTLVYDGSNNVYLSKALPGSSITKTFTVRNTGTQETTYNLYWTEVSNDFNPTSDLVYSLSSTNNGGNLSEKIAPNTNSLILSSIAISPLTTQVYTLVLWFKETGSNQNSNMGKMFNGKIEITSQKQTEIIESGTSPLTLLNSNGTSMLGYKIYGNTTQEEGASPTTPKEVVSLGDNYLPSEYTQMEYIEGTGTQYIDTGISDGYTLYIDLAFNDVDDRNLMGQSTEAGNYFGMDNNNHYELGGGQIITDSDGTIRNEVVIQKDIQENKLLLTFGNQTIQRNINQVSTTTFKILGGLSGYNSSAKIYHAKFYQNGVIVRNMVPAVRNADDEVGMYDTITGTFYEKSGSGAFNVSSNKGYGFDIKVSGKNLFDAIINSNQHLVTTEVLSNYTIKQVGTSTSNSGGYSQFKVYLEAGNYNLSARWNGNGTGSLSKRLYLWKGINATIGTVTSLSMSNNNTFYNINFMITDSNYYWIGAYGSVYKDEYALFDIQIEKGSVRTDYEPYVSKNIVPIVLNEPLRCIDSYCDYVDFRNNQVVRKVAKIIYDENSFISFSSNYSNTDYKTYTNNFGRKLGFNIQNVSSYMTHFSRQASVWASHGDGKYTLQDAYSNGSAITWFSLNAATYPTTADFKNWLFQEKNINHNPVILYYPLVEETYDNVTLPIVGTVNSGTTIIEINDRVMNPTNMEIEYQNKVG